MSRPQLEVPISFAVQEHTSSRANRRWLRWTHLKVLVAIARCRTAAVGLCRCQKQ
jgi:hypothetical protein